MSEVAAVFLKLGIIGFGGPAAHVALMQSEVVDRRRWLTRERFLDLLGATNLRGAVRKGAEPPSEFMRDARGSPP
ncbi:MAG: chromate transporter [Candidatus Rokubacteria bacterium]|nr:chromate transporter [Candidatus Rokubacteria bacterium]